MKKRPANLLRLIHMHSKHFQRAPRWQTALAIIACAFLAKWAPAQTEPAASAKAGAPGTSAQAAKLPKFDITKPLGDTYAAAPSLAIEQVRVVIYRPHHTDEKAGVISVYLNERYHTSLQQDAFSILCLDTTQAQMRTRLIDVHGDQNDALDTSKAMTFQRGQSVFLRVTDLKDGRTRMDVVPAKTANQDLSLARQQKHALSRAPDARPCKQEQATIVTFGAEAAFQPEQTALSSDGEKEMLQIADKINRKYKSLDGVKVHVVGYADDTPDERKNEQLSLARALAVRSYLTNQGLQTQGISHEGRGSKDKQIAMVVGRSGRRVEVAVVVELR
jgi:outer membrane protein OmpA-like peptidoglycan-associated protein